MDRRHFLKGTLALPALAGSGFVAPAWGQERWPTRNITMVVPFPPGGQADLAARPIAAALEKILGQSVIVENRGGAGGAIGNAAVAKAEPDGHTILMTLSSLAVLPESERLFGRTPSYEVSQLAPIARVLADPTVLGVPADAPWKTLKELVDDAKKRPGEIPVRLVRPVRDAACVDGDVRHRRRHQASARALSRRRSGGDRTPLRPDPGAGLGARRVQATCGRGQGAHPCQLGR